jgi:colicin import membrane protein
MKNLVFCLMLGLASAAWAQVTPEPDGSPVATERARMQSLRNQAQSQFAQEEIQCYQKFAVNDCLQKARVIRRDLLADLRRQDLSLNAAEAKRKGAEQLARIEEKSSPKALQEDAERLAKAQADQQERQREFDEKAAARAAAAREAPEHLKENEDRLKTSEQSRADRAAQAASAPANKGQYDAKQLEAQQREAQRQKRLSEPKKPATTGLPLPP